MPDWAFALNTFRLPNTQEGVGLLRTCIRIDYPTLRVQGEFPWAAVIYECGPQCCKVRARVISREPYCAVSINNVLDPFGLWIPSTAEVIANLGIFFSGPNGTIQIIEKKNAPMERRSVCATAKHN